MSEMVRNLIWLLPSATETENVSLLVKMAAQAGLELEDRRGERAERSRPANNCLIVVDHPAAVAAADPHHWIIVQSNNLEDSVVALNARHPEWTRHDTVTNLSVSLAFANYLVLHGAAPVDDVSGILEMYAGATPGVSRVGRDQGRHALGLYEVLPVAPNASAKWEPDDFYYTNGSQRVGGAPDIDLTGGGRILVHGPNIALTPGRWHLEAEFDLDSGGEVVDLRFDWGHGEETATVTYKLAAAGRYRIELARTWLENQTAEFRLWIQHGMLHGTIRFGGARINRLD